MRAYLLPDYILISINLIFMQTKFKKKLWTFCLDNYNYLSVPSIRVIEHSKIS